MTVIKTDQEILNELLASDEGATVSVLKGVSVPTKGYCVALADHELIVNHVESEGEIVLDWVNKNIKRAAFSGYYLGSWVNTDNDAIYFDVVRIYSEKAAAISAGKANHQIGIYDLTNDKEIRLV